MFCTIAMDKFWREKSRNRGYKLGDLKDEVTKPSIEDHLDGPDLGMVVQDGQVSTGLKEPTSFLWKLQIVSGFWCIERTNAFLLKNRYKSLSQEIRFV